MRRSTIVIMIITLLISQVAYTQTRKSRTSAFQKSVVADKTWSLFFKKLQIAVKHRDRVKLREMMIPEFHFTLGHHANSQQNDWRDEAFKYWDNLHNPGWKALSRTLAKGTVPMADWWREGNQQKSPPTRVAPPSANIRRNIDRELVDYIAIFEFHNGHWYFTSFDVCCD
jgi:hypothetical protein